MIRFFVSATLAAMAAMPWESSYAEVSKFDYIITNQTSVDIVAVHASAITDDEWGDDRLKGQIVRPGQAKRVDMSNPQRSCLMDIRVRFGDGDAKVLRGIDVCTSRGLTAAPVSSRPFPSISL